MLGWKLIDSGVYTLKFPMLKAEHENLACMLLEKLLENPVGQEKLLTLLKELCREKNLVVEKDAGMEILEVVKKTAFGFGIFDPLLADDNLEEISVSSLNTPIRVYVRKKGWQDTNALITSQEFLVNSINKMAKGLGRRITTQNPRLNAVLPDGSRLHALIPPIALDGAELTIRKFRKNPLSIADFIEGKTISARAAAFLSLALETDVSIMISGNTGSGKTSFLNALFTFVPSNERVVIVEESPEISIPHPHKIRLAASEELGVSLGDLVLDTLRMRPDRVIVGEVRSKDEVHALFDSLMAGQARGCYSTFHADSASETLSRLKSLGVSEQDLGSLDLIIALKRIALNGTEERKAMEISEVNAGKVNALYAIGKDFFLEEKNLAKSRIVKKLCFSRAITYRQFLGLLEEREKEIQHVVDEKQVGKQSETK